MVDAPQNAPAGAAFLSVVYAGGEGGPQHVDWTWQPRSSALRPQQTRVLFDRACVPQAATLSIARANEREKRVAQHVAFFWMMVPIVAKAIARRQPWVAVSLLVMVRHAVEQASWLIGSQSEEPYYPTKAIDPPPARSSEQIGYLRLLAEEMERLADADGTVREAASCETRQQLLAVVDLAAAST